jgi:hypothetical protein
MKSKVGTFHKALVKGSQKKSMAPKAKKSLGKVKVLKTKVKSSSK